MAHRLQWNGLGAGGACRSGQLVRRTRKGGKTLSVGRTRQTRSVQRQQAFSVRVECKRVRCAVCRKAAPVIYHVSEFAKPTPSPDGDSYRSVWIKMPHGWWILRTAVASALQVRCPVCLKA